MHQTAQSRFTGKLIGIKSGLLQSSSTEVYKLCWFEHKLTDQFSRRRLSNQFSRMKRITRRNTIMLCSRRGTLITPSSTESIESGIIILLKNVKTLPELLVSLISSNFKDKCVILAMTCLVVDEQ